MKQGIFRMKEYLEDVISIKWLAIGVIFYFYGVMLKKEIVKAAYEKKVYFNNWDITLRLLNDMYLIVYFIIPIMLFFSIKSIFVNFDYQILIRLGSFKKWVYSSLKHFWMKIAPLLFLWVFVSLFMMIGFPYSWDWSQLSKTKHFTNTLDELVKFFETPISAFAAQLILLTLIFSLLHIALAIVYVLTKSKYFVLSISVMIFLGSIVGFKLLPREVAFLSPTTFFSIAKGVNTFNSPILSYIVILVFGILSILFLQILDLNKKVYVQSIKSYIPIGIYFFLCVIGISSTANSLIKSADVTIWDVWVMSFIGVSTERFAYIPFFFYLIVFFGFIYLVQLLFLSNEIEQLGYYKIIRFRSLNKWFWSWMQRLLIAVALFLFTLMGLSLVIAVCFRMNTSFYVTILSNPLYEVIYHFFINGFLQIVFYIIAVFIVSWVSKESIHGMLLVSVFMILMLPGVNVAGIIPVGLNGIVYLADYSPYYLTLILIVMNAIAFSVVNYLFKRSLKI
ncbi:hypothetical protein PNH38_16970 [Anoxybacillus rupiensis]|uniref:Permease n=1 Tax=Anoxybacteroides rupiense TaxID=311460 RepID=A0ABT5W9P4_9BACL|nr:MULTISPECIES: hypothetical protein [Anoxybacillus]MBS2771892.1 hypothetical protein [Anoxybacillus rupiensis]MDE8565539.1 hypothetical protein [Anoxybacillus rupiensis]OQM44782.1 hypothetical protein B6A27_15105 [Anoxybacillus sp. UARK-01]QHC02806.1 hypothetical protein GRQ40_01510 [Anoxybacillus sp. PDR2]